MTMVITVSIVVIILDEKAAKRKVDEESVEGKKLAVMMMPRKKRKLYDKIMYGKKKKAAEVCLFLLIYDFMLIYFRPYLVLVHMCDTKSKASQEITVHSAHSWAKGGAYVRVLPCGAYGGA